MYVNLVKVEIFVIDRYYSIKNKNVIAVMICTIISPNIVYYTVKK